MIVLACGWCLGRRVLAETEPLTCLALSLGLGLVLLLLGVNGLLLMGLSMGGSLLVTVLLLSLGTAAVIWKMPAPALSPRPLNRLTLGILGLTSAFVWFYTNLSQNIAPDDDYWIHTPLQGLLVRGRFPLVHPFFSDIEMGGHYGRDLLIAALSRLTNFDIFYIQGWHTSLIQVAAYILLFFTVLRFSNSQLQAVLASWFFLFGVNAGGRGGMLDTYQNNNAMVYFQMVLLLYLVRLCWENQSWQPALLTGLVLGNYAVVYETHFGLVILAGATCLSVALLQEGFTPHRQRLKTLIVVLLVATPLALTQGGPFTKLSKKLFSPQKKAVSEYSPGELNQHQVVTIKFPKEELFQIQLGYGNYQRISCVYDTSKWLSHLSTIEPGKPYRAIWSWEVLKLHWLALFLSPLSLLILLRSRDRTGLLYWSLGLWAYLVPALVNFGPIYEFEYFRWEFAAAVGFTVALGCAAGRVASPLLNSPRAGRIALGFTLVWALTWANTLAVQRTFVPRLAASFWERSSSLADLLWMRTTSQWLKQNHDKLAVEPEDLEMTNWLKTNSQPGDRMLMNFREIQPWDILQESTLVGLTGVRSVGHSMPLDSEPIGTPPYHMTAAARAFWGAVDYAQLEQLQVDWLYVRAGTDDLLQSLDDLPQATLVHKSEDSLGQRFRLFRIERSADAYPSVRSQQEAEGYRVQSFELPTDLEDSLLPSVCYFARVQLELPDTPAGRLAYLAQNVDKAPSDLTEAVAVSWPGSEGRIPLVAPHSEGEYRLDFFLWDESGMRPIAVSEEVRIRVGQPEQQALPGGEANR